MVSKFSKKFKLRQLNRLAAAKKRKLSSKRLSGRQLMRTAHRFLRSLRSTAVSKDVLSVPAFKNIVVSVRALNTPRSLLKSAVRHASTVKNVRSRRSAAARAVWKQPSRSIPMELWAAMTKEQRRDFFNKKAGPKEPAIFSLLLSKASPVPVVRAEKLTRQRATKIPGFERQHPVRLPAAEWAKLSRQQKDDFIRRSRKLKQPQANNTPTSKVNLTPALEAEKQATKTSATAKQHLARLPAEEWAKLSRQQKDDFIRRSRKLKRPQANNTSTSKVNLTPALEAEKLATKTSATAKQHLARLPAEEWAKLSRQQKDDFIRRSRKLKQLHSTDAK